MIHVFLRMEETRWKGGGERYDYFVVTLSLATRSGGYCRVDGLWDVGTWAGSGEDDVAMLILAALTRGWMEGRGTRCVEEVIRLFGR